MNLKKIFIFSMCTVLIPAFGMNSSDLVIFLLHGTHEEETLLNNTITSIEEFIKTIPNYNDQTEILYLPNERDTGNYLNNYKNNLNVYINQDLSYDCFKKFTPETKIIPFVTLNVVSQINSNNNSKNLDKETVSFFKTFTSAKIIGFSNWLHHTDEWKNHYKSMFNAVDSDIQKGLILGLLASCLVRAYEINQNFNIRDKNFVEKHEDLLKDSIEIVEKNNKAGKLNLGDTINQFFNYVENLKKFNENLFNKTETQKLKTMCQVFFNDKNETIDDTNDTNEKNETIDDTNDTNEKNKKIDDANKKTSKKFIIPSILGITTIGIFGVLFYYLKTRGYFNSKK